MRVKLVKALHAQLVRHNKELARDASDAEESLVMTDQALITMALDIEEKAGLNASIYGNIVKNHIMVYKRMTVGGWKDERAKEIARQKALTDASTTPQATEAVKVIETGLTPQEELAMLPRLYTSIEGLAKHGYIEKPPSSSEIASARAGVEASRGFEVCDRCRTRFQVFPGRREEDGVLASGGQCVYHFGKAFFQEKSSGSAGREKRYRCCGEAVGESTGCTSAEHHVFKITDPKRLAAILDFAAVSTDDAVDEQGKAPVCIDGEMGYTVCGLELIRLTATAWPNYDELLDVLVRPEGEILDLNSRYSGVWPKDFTEALPYTGESASGSASSSSSLKPRLRIVSSIAEARSLLFKHLTPSTPIIGHGLENDLNAARILHPTLIDTALLYPHRAGLPFRNGLKALMSQHLGRDIQMMVNGKMHGHDSKEDANAAGDLVRFRLATDWARLQREGWRVEHGTFVSPAGERVTRFVAEQASKKRSRSEMEAE